jgi:hypothetical protein
VVCLQGTTLGAAFYDSRDGRLSFLPDRREGADFDTLQVLKTQFQPTIIVISSRTKPQIMKAVELQLPGALGGGGKGGGAGEVALTLFSCPSFRLRQVRGEDAAKVTKPTSLPLLLLSSSSPPLIRSISSFFFSVPPGWTLT